MAQTRLEAASQGLMENIDVVQRGWALVGLFCLFAFFLIGYLVTQHKNRLKNERASLQKQQKKSEQVRKG